MKKLIVILFAACSISMLNAQTDTIYYNASWEPCKKSQAQFFRLKLTPSDEGFLLRDFYISGTKQFEGITLSEESDVYQGKATWYYENGNTEQVANFENGIKQGEFVNYDKQGNLLAKGIYKDDAPFEGSFSESSEYITQISIYVEGALQSAETYDPTNTSKARISVKVTNSELLNGEILYFNQKGESIGKIIIEENQPKEGIIVDYSYRPMSVLSIMEVSNGAYKSPFKYFYSNGTIKKLVFFESDYNYPNKEVYYDINNKIIDSLLLEDSSPLKGRKIEFFSSYETSNSDQVETISEYSEGQLNGAYKTFYTNGKLRFETNYANGYETGDRITYDSLGNKLYTLSYREGMPWTGTLSENENSITYEEGVRKEEKQYYPDGKTMLILTSDGVETTYDPEGKEVGRLQYKNGEPYEGKKVSIYYSTIGSEEIYSNGIKTKYITYSDGTPSQVIEYYDDGNYKKEIYYYSNGKLKKEILYAADGTESGHNYYDSTGKPMGTLSFGKYASQTGDRYEFDGDNILSHILYDNETIIRTWTYDNGELISDVSRNGKSYFYDKPNNKTYVCTYKEGEPYSGTKFDYDTDYNGISKIESYKNGLPEGETIEYTYVYTDDSYSSGALMPEYVYQYKNGLKEGQAKQYYRDKLIRTMNYSNDMLEGEYKTYDLKGNLLSTVIYRESLPFQGDVIDYDYTYEQISSVNTYVDGNLHGDQKYFEYGNLKRLETYDNGVILKEVGYLMGYAYELTYLNSEPFEGKKIDTYSYTISEYHEGVPVLFKTYTDGDFTMLKDSEKFLGENSVKTTYYDNGNVKEVSEKSGYERQGKTTYYNSDGVEIASGIFESNQPSSGTFAYYSNSNETDYLVLQIDKNSFKVTEYIAGAPGGDYQYKRATNSESSLSDEIQKFISSVQLMFDSYVFDEESGWYY